MLKELLWAWNTREGRDLQEQTQNKKMVIGTYISITTLNVNELHAPTKRYRLAEWIQKQDPRTCCLQETQFRPRNTYRLQVRGWKKIFHANGNQKKAGVAILISDKTDFKIKTIRRDKEGHYVMIKVSIQEDIFLFYRLGKIFKEVMYTVCPMSLLVGRGARTWTENF